MTWRVADLSLVAALAVFLTVAVSGCSDKPTSIADVTPPDRVTDLTVTEVSDHSATLEWTAPGDDGTKGRARQYDLRYDAKNVAQVWETATPLDSLPRPQEAGALERTVVESLTAETTYYFALRAVDEAGNWSPEISNVASVRVSADTIPPAQIDDLTVEEVTHQSVRLAWTAPGDNGNQGQASAYEVRYSTQMLTDGDWDTAILVENSPSPGPAGAGETLDIGGLVDATEYYFGVKAEDESINWSPLSNVASVTTLPDTIPPATVTDLAIVDATTSTLTLAWTAPGDDGTVGRASAYEVRYGERPVHAWTWAEAQPVAFPPAPSASGERELVTIPLLEPGQRYYFALRAADERDNWSAISNDPQGSPRVRAGRTWRVRPDGSGDVLTVQAGIEISADGDVVLVGPGTYYENINLKGKAIHLLGELGPEATILDGSLGDGPVVTCESGENNDTVIEGLTITRGKGRLDGSGGRHGAGIYCTGSSPAIRNNIVIENRAESPPGYIQSWGGGLIFFGNSERLIVENCVFERNFATVNAGAIMAAGPCVVRRNVLRGNRTERGDGAGLYIVRTPSSIYCDNLIVDNHAGDHGGGILVSNGEANAVASTNIEICNNVIVHNSSHTADAPDCSGGGVYIFGGAFLHHNTIAFNSSTSRNFPSGGGMCVVNTDLGAIIENNLVYRNHEGGIVAFKYSGVPARADIRRNLVYENGRAEIFNKYEPNFHFELEENIFADPMFCVDGSESRGEVAGASPALNQSFGIVGAVDEPGCGPYITGDDQSGVWGSLNSRYTSTSSP